MTLDDRNKIHALIEEAIADGTGCEVETGGGGLCHIGDVEEVGEGDDKAYWVCVRIRVSHDDVFG